jgi:hypothetical protein
MFLAHSFALSRQSDEYGPFDVPRHNHGCLVVRSAWRWTGHIERWCERNTDARLTMLSEEESWERSTEATIGIARAVYLSLPEGTPLWVERDTFRGSEREVLGDLLAHCGDTGLRGY